MMKLEIQFLSRCHPFLEPSIMWQKFFNFIAFVMIFSPELMCHAYNKHNSDFMIYILCFMFIKHVSYSVFFLSAFMFSSSRQSQVFIDFLGKEKIDYKKD